MKKQVILLYLITFCLICLSHVVVGQNDMSRNAPARTLKLMTYNLKFASPDYQPSWEIRREMQINLIRKYSPDIIGTQEGLKEQIDYLA